VTQYDSATILIRVPTPEDGRMRPKHVVEEYTQHKMKNVVFQTMITLKYRRLMVTKQDAEIQHYTASNDQMTMNNELDRLWKKAVRG
jgi:hypothetical protein